MNILFLCLDHKMSNIFMCLDHEMNILFVCLDHKMNIRSSPQFVMFSGAGCQKNRFLYRFYSQHHFIYKHVAWPVNQMHDLQSSLNSLGKGSTRRRTKEEEK